jgi:tRNA-2-methylthio-N6-dimethylallyladenosine synthase
MNEDDSRQMANLLEQMGYRPASEEVDADIILLNTCSVRAKPEQKVRSKLGELRMLKEVKRDLIIGVCGCMAQREGKELLKRAPFIDIIMGTASIPELPMLVTQVKQGGGRGLALEMPEKGDADYTHFSRVAADVGLKTFVPVMFGCNNYCAYCVVPYARGPERSRPADDVVVEVTDLVARGCREVTLVGQNVNSYSSEASQSSEKGTDKKPIDFAALLRMLNGISGLERIRFTTSHPKDLSDSLIDAIADLDKVCTHMHLPLQSGDNDVLRRMGRGYTLEQYKELVSKLRTQVPGIALTTDILIGFPGETEEQFENTLNAVETIQYDAAFMFAFSARPGTAAARMDGHIDSVTKNRRLRQLISLQNGITLERAKAAEGTVFEVLVEGTSAKDPNKLSGYTQTNKTVNFLGDQSLIGKLVMVRAIKAHPWGFTGEIADL